MKKQAVVGLVACFSAASALGGVVTFGTDNLVVPVGTGEVVLMVTLNPDSPQVDAATTVIGSQNVPMTAFEFLPGFNVFTTLEGPFISPNGPGIYPYEVYFGGSVSPNPVSFDSVVVGNLTVDLSTLAEGDYTIFVDNEQDFGLSAASLRGTTEPLTGSLRISIVPEPATLSLLGLGLLAALRRRRTA